MKKPHPKLTWDTAYVLLAINVISAQAFNAVRRRRRLPANPTMPNKPIAIAVLGSGTLPVVLGGVTVAQTRVKPSRLSVVNGIAGIP